MNALDELASLIDHTVLVPVATRADVETLCREAIEERFAAVCVNPLWVAVAAATGVKVASVAGFPLGATSTAAKVRESERALEDGAREVDMVLAIGLLKGAEGVAVRDDVAAVAEAVHAQGAILKVTLETGLLTLEEKERAARLAVEGGTDFLKTSTGFAGSGATVEDVALLRRIAPAGCGVEASGGVRTFAAARAMMAAGATRIGTSSGLAIMAEARAYYASR